MKRIFILTLLLTLCILITETSAQKRNSLRIFKQGQTDGWMSLGLVPTYIMDGAAIVIPPINIGADHMVSDNISIGAIIGHSVSHSQPTGAGGDLKTYRNSYWFAGLRTAVHCTKFDNIDIYGGFTLGYNQTLVDPLVGGFGELEKHLGIRPKKGKVTYSSILGVRYSCCGQISFFGELGWSSSLVTMGVGYRLK